MPTPRTLTQAEQSQLLDLPMNHRSRLLILLMLDAGLRVGETVQLEIMDVYGNVQPVNTLQVRAEITKTKTIRYIPLTLRLQATISLYIPLYVPLSVFKPTDWLFPSVPANRHLTTRSIQRHIAKLGHKHLNRTITPHMLRHTFATRIMRTTNARVCQELLGHKKLSSTQVYTHPNHDDLTKAIEAL